MKKNLKQFIFYSFLILCSCSDVETEIQYYSTGEPELKKYKSKDGLNVTFEYLYKSGKVKKVLHEYKGKLSGVVNFYFENGDLEQTGNYKNGKLDGEYTFYRAKNSLYEKSIYWKGEKIEDIFYHENGKKKTHYFFNGNDSLAAGEIKFDEIGSIKEIFMTPILRIDKNGKKGIKIFYRIPDISEGFNYKIHIGVTSLKKLEQQDFSGEQIYLIEGTGESEVYFDSVSPENNVVFAYIEIRNNTDPLKKYPTNHVFEKIDIR